VALEPAWWSHTDGLTRLPCRFLFGGGTRRDKFAYDDAYILSLPAFVWKKVTSPTTGRRSLHVCTPVGGGQVLSIGGLNTERDDEYRQKDPAPQGLELFDMTKLEWTDSYDASRWDVEYKRSDVVNALYNDGYVQLFIIFYPSHHQTNSIV
jgi:hypothetical protein